MPDNAFFMIDNTSFEEIDMKSIIKTFSNHNSAIKHAILGQQKSFNYNKQNINNLLTHCQKFDSFDCSSIKPIYLTNKNLLKSIEAFLNAKDKLLNDVNPQIARLNEQLNNATVKLNEYSD